jgi:hypothetical protein
MSVIDADDKVLVEDTGLVGDVDPRMDGVGTEVGIGGAREEPLKVGGDAEAVGRVAEKIGSRVVVGYRTTVVVPSITVVHAMVEEDAVGRWVKERTSERWYREK